MNNHLTSEQIEAEIVAIIRETARRNGANAQFNFAVEQPDDGLRFSVTYDRAWRYRRHVKVCLWATAVSIVMHWACAFLYWIKLVSFGVFFGSILILIAVSVSSYIYLAFFATPLADADKIYREAAALVSARFGKSYNAKLNDLT